MKRRRSKADPWKEVLEQHITSERPADGALGRGRPGRPWLVGGAALIAVLVVVIGVLTALTLINYGRANDNLERAERWQERSTELSVLVEERTRGLNRQTARLNVASNRLRSARRSVVRSEEDVETLEQRQRELAAEKADVEDEREQLRQAASAFEQCEIELISLLDGVLGGYATQADLNAAAAICTEAEEAFASAQATSGAP